MHQETARAGLPREMTAAGWLFNPFVRIGGEQALAFGSSIIVVGGLVAGAADVHFDGLLDFHPGYSVSFWVPVVEGLVNWSVISVLLALVALLVAPRTVRLIDVVGTQALARVPLLPAALACLPAPVRDGNAELASAAADGRIATLTTATLVAGLLASACVIWMVWLMWKAFAVSCNQRGVRGVAIFMAAVIAGEVATKFLLIRVLGGLMAGGMPAES